MLADKGASSRVIDDVIGGAVGVIHPDLLAAYGDNLRRGVAGVFGSVQYGGKYFDIAQRLQANVTRFAAYKAYTVTEAIRRAQADENGEILPRGEYEKRARDVLNTFNRYQAAEYNTTVSRSRTARQWQNFTSDETSEQLFPNLRWLPSRSAEPRAEHVPFYNRIWPKDDPFWLHNQPGNLWNCKCDWEETADAVDGAEIQPHKPLRGLGGNPGVTGQVFTDDAVYFRQLKGTDPREVENAYARIDRKRAEKELAKLYDRTVEVSLGADGTAAVGFNRRGCKHIVADLRGGDLYALKNQIAGYMDKYLADAQFVAYEANGKPDEKPGAQMYYYFRFTFPGGRDGYFTVEKSTAGKYILYAVTDRLRESAIRIK